MVNNTSKLSSTPKSFSNESLNDINNYIFFLLLIIIIIIACIANIFLYHRGFYSISADECSRTIEAYLWTLGKTDRAPFWPPFHRVIVGLALDIWPDLFLTPRIISFVFGIISLCSLIWLSYEIFRNKQITVVTALLGAVFPQRVVLSAVPLSEIMFISMILSGSTFLFRYILSQNIFSLLLSSLFFAISCTIRYEGWIFSGCVFIFVLVFFFYNKARARARVIVLTGAVLFAFPVYWMALHYFQTGNPLSFMSETASRYTLLYNNSFATIFKKSLLPQFISQNFISFNLLGLLSLIPLVLIDNRIRKWIVVPAMSFSIMSLLSLVPGGLPSHNFWRISSVWSILLVPFTAHWILEQKKLFFNLKLIWKYGLLFFILLIFFLKFFLQILNMTQYSAFSVYDRFAGQYLNKQLSVDTASNGSKILIETSDWSHMNVVIASQHPDSFVYNTVTDSPYQPQEYVVDSKRPFNETSLVDMRIKFMIFRTQQYKNYLEQDANISKIKDFGYWSIYKLRNGIGK